MRSIKINVLYLCLLTTACTQNSKSDEESNVAPSFTSIEIIPATEISTSTELVCRATATDENNDPLTLTISWTDSDGEALGNDVALQLTPESFRPGAEITCTATVTDGQSDPIQESVSIVVDNTLPVIDDVSIAPDEEVRVDSTLTCSATGTDADTEELEWAYTWSTEAGELGSGAEITLTADTVDAGDTVTCKATATDTSGGSVSDEVAVTVENSKPVIGSLSLSPEEPRINDDLTCTASDVSDIDGDTVEINFAWMIDGAQAGDGTDTLSGPFTVDSVIECWATPNDGTEDGDVVTVSTVIGNTAPTVDSVSITPNTGIEADALLQCSHTASDTDGDDLVVVYGWTDGLGNQLGSGESLQLSPSIIGVGDEVICTATVDDGSVTASATASVLVDNTAPEVSVAASISPSTAATTGTTLTCSAEISDLNDGALNVNYEWTNATGAVISSTASYTIAASETDPGEALSCTASGADYEGLSASSSASIVVENTAPTSPVVSIDGGYVGEADLVCSIDVTSTDNDEQSVSYIYEWTDASGGIISTSSPTTNLSNTVLANQTSYGSWTCTVYATDGTDNSIGGVAMLALDYSINTRSPGDLIITELMQNPASVSDSNGEWFEIYNKTSEDINLLGLVLTDPADSVTVDQVVYIPAGGYAVLGNNADINTNGGVAVDYEYSSLSLNNSGDQFLSIGNASGDLDVVTWGDSLSMYAPNGSSMTLSIDAYSDTDNDDKLYWCESVTSMSSGDNGTPGAENESCDFDGDGTYFAEDCDDESTTSETTSTDGDCDGVLTDDDCDDTDSSSTTVATDADCDGTITVDDCDDTDPLSTTVATDGDCDGILTDDDCDDTDPLIHSGCD